VAAVLTEIYLCNVCSCQETLRRNGRGQRLAPSDALSLTLSRHAILVKGLYDARLPPITWPYESVLSVAQRQLCTFQLFVHPRPASSPSSNVGGGAAAEGRGGGALSGGGGGGDTAAPTGEASAAAAAQSRPRAPESYGFWAPALTVRRLVATLRELLEERAYEGLSRGPELVQRVCALRVEAEGFPQLPALGGAEAATARGPTPPPQQPQGQEEQQQGQEEEKDEVQEWLEVWRPLRPF
jgi:hypothetical protein